MPSELLRQVREEMQRSYKPGAQSLERASSSQLPGIDSAALRSALAALYSSYALVGQLPPEPPSLRGRIGAQLVKLIQRLLFWYTPQIVHFQYSAVQAIEELAKQNQRLREQLEEARRRDRDEWRTVFAAAESRMETVNRRLEALRIQTIARLEREIARMRPQQIALERRIAQLIAEARNRPPEASGTAPLPAPVTEDQHNFDGFYAALEDEFRGSREEIKERLSVYLPRLAVAGIGGESMPILDVGCGRGEWLELLREQQLDASGIDQNLVVLGMCQERGLPVREGNALEYLRSLPEKSLGAVTAFHVIEHLTLPQLLDLWDSAWRALKPGGMAIFETPNPNNVFVGARNFYLDPTHRHPIPPLLGRFLAESHGFERVEILELHPCPVELIDTRTGGDVAARFNECFYGPQDYAIIGWKA